MSATSPELLLKALEPDELRSTFASPVVVTASGTGTACLHCAGRGYRTSTHPLPWLDATDQGVATYRTKLCCLYCAGLGFILAPQPEEAPAPDQAPPLVAEPYIDVEFDLEE